MEIKYTKVGINIKINGNEMISVFKSSRFEEGWFISNGRVAVGITNHNSNIKYNKEKLSLNDFVELAKKRAKETFRMDFRDDFKEKTADDWLYALQEGHIAKPITTAINYQDKEHTYYLCYPVQNKEKIMRGTRFLPVINKDTYKIYHKDKRSKLYIIKNKLGDLLTVVRSVVHGSKYYIVNAPISKNFVEEIVNIYNLTEGGK